MANWAVGDLSAGWIKKRKKRNGVLLLFPQFNPQHFRSGRKSVPLDCLPGLHPVSTNAAGTNWSPGYCSYWQGHDLAGLRTLCFCFNHRWCLRSLFLVSQLCFSCSLDTTSLCMVFDNSFSISEKLPNLLCFQRSWIWKNQSEHINCRQVEVERKPDKGRGKLCVMMILVRVGLKVGRGKDKNKPQNPKTNRKTLNFDCNTCMTASVRISLYQKAILNSSSPL